MLWNFEIDILYYYSYFGIETKAHWFSDIATVNVSEFSTKLFCSDFDERRRTSFLMIIIVLFIIVQF